MDRSLGTVASPRGQNVTNQILRTNNVYGSSYSSNPAYAVANKSLNYAEGGSIQRPQLERVSIIPFQLKYQDTVGLFGKENHFVKVSVDINPDVAFSCFEEEFWECAVMTDVNELPQSTYLPAIIDRDIDDTQDVNYQPAKLSLNSLARLSNAFVSVDLTNLKTGNKYIDAWLDVRLYTRNRQEHPYDKMYVRLKDTFYIGFHARNTKRLPYNVECAIGQEYVSFSSKLDSRYINK